MVGSGDRSERIRTYNFPQGRVTDHRISLTLHKLEEVLAGPGLGELIDALVAEDEAKRLAAMDGRSEEHTSEIQSLMRISYAVFRLKQKTHTKAHIERRNMYQK